MLTQICSLWIVCLYSALVTRPMKGSVLTVYYRASSGAVIDGIPCLGVGGGGGDNTAIALPKVYGRRLKEVSFNRVSAIGLAFYRI